MQPSQNYNVYTMTHRFKGKYSTYKFYTPKMDGSGNVPEINSPTIR